MNKDLFPECIIFILTIAFVISSIQYINNSFKAVEQLNCSHSVYCYEVTNANR